MTAHKRKRLKAGKISHVHVTPQVHDRTAADLPINANIRVLTVDDPYELGGRIVVAASTRDDPLGRLHARDRIDTAQYQAGRHWQRLCEEAEISPLRAMDTTLEPVDGGGRPANLITDRNKRAIAGLAEAAGALGREGACLVRDILEKRTSVEMAASARGLDDERGRLYVGRRFRECLETLAILWGYATRP